MSLCDDGRDDIEHGAELDVARIEVRNLVVNGIGCELDALDSCVLHRWVLSVGDFLDALARVQPGDFCFIDSPYAPLNPTSFESYAKEGFTEEQHRTLAAEFRRLDEIGAKLMLTNHDTDLIRELYDGFDIIEVDVRRSINRNGDGRTGVEVIITNGYENRIEK